MRAVQAPTLESQFQLSSHSDPPAPERTLPAPTLKSRSPQSEVAPIRPSRSAPSQLPVPRPQSQVAPIRPSRSSIQVQAIATTPSGGDAQSGRLPPPGGGGTRVADTATRRTISDTSSDTGGSDLLSTLTRLTFPSGSSVGSRRFHPHSAVLPTRAATSSPRSSLPAKTSDRHVWVSVWINGSAIV